MKLDGTDNGNCLVYYKENKKLLCFQLTTRAQYELLACTKDGEPSHPVSFEGKTIDKLPPEENSTSREFVSWVKSLPAGTLTVGKPKREVDDSPSP
jgi:hypothetical protein